MNSNAHRIYPFPHLTRPSFIDSARRRFCPPDHWLIPPFMFTTSFKEFIHHSTIESPSSSNNDPSSSSSARPHPSITTKSILANIPFVIPFKTRVSILRNRIDADRSSGGGAANDWMAPRVRVKIRREFMFEDGYALLNGLGASLKGRIAITFINEQGLQEAGIDGGGVFKEFLTG